MVTTSKGLIGSLLAQTSSFCESINSQVVSDGNVLLGDDEIDKLVVLRMNREFMKFGRQYYAHRLNEPFGKFGTVLTVESNVEMGAVDLDSNSHSD